MHPSTGQQSFEECLECVICQEYFKNACDTSCGHSFFDVCISQWLNSHKTCPICQKEASPIHPNWPLRSIVSLFQKNAQTEHDNKQQAEKAKKIGNDFYRNSNYPEALENYSKAIALTPEDYTLYNNRSQCYLKLGEYQRALQEAEKALELKPDSVKAYIRKAMSLEGLGANSAGLETLSIALAFDSNQEFAMEIQTITERLRKTRV